MKLHIVDKNPLGVHSFKFSNLCTYKVGSLGLIFSEIIKGLSILSRYYPSWLYYIFVSRPWGEFISMVTTNIYFQLNNLHGATKLHSMYRKDNSLNYKSTGTQRIQSLTWQHDKKWMEIHTSISNRFKEVRDKGLGLR